MSGKRADISTIRKYLAGELDARAMHQLEREAQDDPFLMEAIEGYASKSTDHQEQLHNLQNRLQQRIHQQKVRRLPARWLMAAASVLVLLGVAYLFWPIRQHSNVNAPMAALTLKTPALEPKSRTFKKSIVHEQLAATPHPSVADKSAQQVSQAVPVPASAMATVTNVAPTAVAAKSHQTDTLTTRIATIQAKQADSVNTPALMAVAKKENPVIANVPVSAMARARTTAVMAVPHTKVNGIVSDETGHSLSGVGVTGKGKSEIVKTDSKGRFSIPANEGDILVFTAPGFKNEEVKGTVSDSLNVILKAESKSLSEMVAIDFGRPAAAPVVKEAHPQVGWDNYNQYLKTYAFITQGKPGTVRLSFTVEANGQLSNMKVVKSLSAEADQIAIHLVKDGPAWVPDVSGKAKTVNLKVAFSLQQK